MVKGYLNLVLHAHLPFVRHPEHSRFLEEDWLFEGISETYLPLLRVFNKLKDDKIPFRVTFSISPTLASMLSDDLLSERYLKHLKLLIELGEKEVSYKNAKAEEKNLAEYYLDFYRQNYDDYVNLYQKNVLRGFKALEKDGFLELITTSATHAYFPVFKEYPGAVDAQIQAAISSHMHHFGKMPKGFWLPECGYYPGVEDLLKKNGIDYFFTSAHGLLLSPDKPEDGLYSTYKCPNGVGFMGRDIASSKAVWSDVDGYPGDFSYRDFYRDIGFDRPLEYISPYLHGDGKIRVNTGYKYYAITGDTDQKKYYNPEVASKKVAEHAENFIYNRVKQLKSAKIQSGNTPVILTPFDAELFGHWWFEGCQWIDQLIRKIADESSLELATTSDMLNSGQVSQTVQPIFSSWGNNGFSEVWLDGSNDWIYPHLHSILERMKDLAKRFPDEEGLRQRILNQAAREVLLAQASDWPFMMHMGTTGSYAKNRVKYHIGNFNKIYDDMCSNKVDTEWITTLEKKDNIFSSINYMIFND
jgi:1,4-alpha-glucan branching enzyme